MIDLKIHQYAELTGTNQQYKNLSLHVDSDMLNIHVVVNSQDYVLYDNSGIKIGTVNFAKGSIENTSDEIVNLSFFFNNVVDIDFEFTSDIPIDTVSSSIPDTSYEFVSGRVFGFFKTDGSGSSGSAPVDLTKYYKFTVSTMDITLEYFVDNVSQYSQLFDNTAEYDDFVHSDFYAYNDMSTVLLDTYHPHPIVFVLNNKDSNNTTDYSGVTFTLDGNTIDFGTISSFRTFKSYLDTVTDKYTLVLDSLGDSSYYVLPASLSSGSSTDSGSSTGSGSSTSTTIDTSNINQILNEIDTKIASSVQSSISSYFTDNPIDVGDVSITSVVNDVTTALNGFFVDGAYVDLSVMGSTLDNLVTQINSLKTAVNSIDTSTSADSSTVDLSSVYARFDNIDSSLLAVPSNVSESINCDSADLSTLTPKFDSVLSAINDISSIDASSLDLSDIQTAIIDVISSNTSSFITGASLNGANGVLYEDGTYVLVDGNNRLFKVVSSQIVTTIGGGADYFYVLIDKESRNLLTVQDNLSVYVPEVITNDDGTTTVDTSYQF